METITVDSSISVTSRTLHNHKGAVYEIWKRWDFKRER